MILILGAINFYSAWNNFNKETEMINLSELQNSFSVTVRRNGKEASIDKSEIVVGDVSNFLKIF